MRYASLEERILRWSVASETNSFEGTRCWEWLGTRRGDNLKYPSLNVRWQAGRRKGKVRCVAVHRLVRKVFKGLRVLPRNVFRHMCHNHNCVNPEHILGGTSRQNNRDTVRAGRHRNQHGATGRGAPC